MANVFKSGVSLKGAVYRPTSLGDALEIVSTVTLARGTTLGVGDKLSFGWVGENVRVEDFVLECDDLDTGTTLTLDLGITDDPDAFLAADTVGRAGGEVIRRSSDTTANNKFAVSPYVAKATKQEVFATVNAAPTGNPDTVRNVSLKLKLFLTPSEQVLTGVTGVTSANLLGTKEYEPATVYTYNQA